MTLIDVDNMWLRDHFRELMAHVKDDQLRDLFATVLEPGADKQSLKRWMREHDGGVVHTIQVGWSPEGRLIRAWSPMSRRVDAGKSSFVRLDESRRDYTGVRAIAATENVWLGTDSTVDAPNIIAYCVTPE